MPEGIQDRPPEHLPLRCWHVVLPVMMAAMLVLASYLDGGLRWRSTSREGTRVIRRDIAGGLAPQGLGFGIHYRTDTCGDVLSAQNKHLAQSEGDGWQAHLGNAGRLPWGGALRQLVGHVTWADTQYPPSSAQPVKAAQGIRQILGWPPPPPTVFRTYAVTISPTLLLSLTSIPLGIGLWKRLRQGSSARQGFCIRCGYDLRATPDRCPECGTIPRDPGARESP